MLRRSFIVSLLLCFGLGAAYGAVKTYASGEIVDLEQRTRDRVQMYLVNTPIMTEDPYITIAINANGTRYEGEFLPGSRHELFPGFWKIHETVQLRVDKHFMYLKREDGSEAKFLILSKSPMKSARNSE